MNILRRDCGADAAIMSVAIMSRLLGLASRLLSASDDDAVIGKIAADTSEARSALFLV